MGTRSAVSGKPHKPPTQARRRGTRCRLHLHLLRGRILLLQNLLTELIQRFVLPLHTVGFHLFMQHFFLCRIQVVGKRLAPMLLIGMDGVLHQIVGVLTGRVREAGRVQFRAAGSAAVVDLNCAA